MSGVPPVDPVQHLGDEPLEGERGLVGIDRGTVDLGLAWVYRGISANSISSAAPSTISTVPFRYGV
ncbi:hypothetical protein ACFXG4_18885 [Nocardia sp. NPDC059246]|uniref:hypothetical protein n=1 Tax=unclassified Nocardia TaxID=2637762 RepID=UPI00368E7204